VAVIGTAAAQVAWWWCGPWACGKLTPNSTRSATTCYGERNAVRWAGNLSSEIARSNEWVGQQRQRLAENEKQLAEMKARLVPEQSEASVAEVPSPITPERLRTRRYWLVVALTILNCMYFLNATYRVFTWPSSVSLFFSDEQVTVGHDAQGHAEYLARVPLKTFPYDVQLQQQHRYDLLWCSSVNLLLLTAIMWSYWQGAKLERTHAQQEPPTKDERQGRAAPDQSGG